MTQALAVSQSSAITYVYGELGRLEAVIDPGQANGIARYTYDNVGNPLSASRQVTSSTFARPAATWAAESAGDAWYWLGRKFAEGIAPLGPGGGW